tara:strand:- start:1162 stop:1275 length:114 start_codon:yes stop_codon:yes gene_type:complete
MKADMLTNISTLVVIFMNLSKEIKYFVAGDKRIIIGK